MTEDDKEEPKKEEPVLEQEEEPECLCINVSERMRTKTALH